MTGSFNFGIVDYGLKTSRVGGYTVDINAGNLAAQDTALDALKTAIDGVSLGVIWSDTRNFKAETSVKSQPASDVANRGNKWLVRGVDGTNGQAWKMEIPCADPSLQVSTGTYMDISGGAGAALVTAIEAVVVSQDGNAVEVQDIVLVTRTL